MSSSPLQTEIQGSMIAVAQGWDWWEQPLCDNSVIYVAWETDLEDIDLVSITHMAANGKVINIFEFDEKGWIKTQCVPEVDALQESYVQAEYSSGLTELTWQKIPIELADERRKDSEYFRYIVQPGDCLWSIAERNLGDGAKWPEIYRDNVDVIGENPGFILPGMELNLSGVR